MPTVTNTIVLDALQRCQVLTPTQLDEVKKDLQVRLAQPQALLQELVRRGWLTLYQGKQILNGRANDLILDRYLLLEPLGQGGVGTVFKARHIKMQRLVALKVLRPEQTKDAEAVQRFYREIEVISQLSHPNIVHAFEAGPIGNLLVLVLEYVDGLDLEKLVQKSGPLPIGQACEYIRQAAVGLQYAHGRGLVHRDIKPSNLLVTKAPGSQSVGLVKLLDLGLARLQQPIKGSKTANLTVLAGNSVMQGTPDYMSPEQAIDFHQADIRSDIYSLGCTLYFLLAGQPPFAGSNLAEKLMKHHQVDPEVESIRPDLPAELVPVLRKMLAKKPADRYQTPGAVAADLQPFCPADGTAASSPSAVTIEIPRRTTKSFSLWNLRTTILERLLHKENQGQQPHVPFSGKKKALVLGSVLAALMVAGLLLRGNGDEKTTPGDRPAPAVTGTITVRLTVDNQYELYINGVQVGSGQKWEQLQEHSAPLQKGVNVIAVKAINTGGPGGLLAEVFINGKRIVSDPHWKVTANFSPGWNTVEFDDRSWARSKDECAYGTGEWGRRVAGLAKDSPAHWIWAQKTEPQQTLYFRYTFSTDDPKVAAYGDNFLFPRPNAGWKYLWNKKGPIGNPAYYEPLLWNTAKGYNVHGRPNLPGPDPGAYVHLEQTGGHPGRGAAQIASKIDYYAIAAYTIQEADGAGFYRITDSSITTNGSGLRVVVHVNDQPLLLTRSVPKDTSPPASFNVNLGNLKPGDTVYVAVGPDGTDGADSFSSFDFTITRGGQDLQAK